mgnify:CR=1 FL=1
MLIPDPIESITTLNRSQGEKGKSVRSLFRSILISMVSLGLVALAGCFHVVEEETSTESISPPPSSIVSKVGLPVGDPNCLNGGARIDYGIDDNSNGRLDPAEVDGSEFVCNGEPGSDGVAGLSSLVSVGNEEAGVNCLVGGVRIDTGIDDNSNGVLDPSEVDGREYLCNGAPGADGVAGDPGADGDPAADGASGLSSLVLVNDELAGANCANGGIRIDSGIDDNDNGSLDSIEIDTTNYVCHGSEVATGAPPADSGVLTKSIITSFHPFEIDSSDQTTFQLIQPFPTSGSTNVNPKAPIILFLDDLINPSTVSDSTVTVNAGSGQIYGYIAGSTSESGNTILTFSSPDGLPENTEVTVNVPTGGVLDKGGNSINSTAAISFTTGADSGFGSSSNLDFESGLGSDFSCIGDCGILSSFGSAPPSQGSQAAYISTGNAIVSSDSAIGDTSSSLSMAPVETFGGLFSFSYDFISEEFDDYVGSEFDDSFVVTLTGPNGSVSTTVATVNSIGITDSVSGTFPGLTAEHTGTLGFSTDISLLGSPIAASFIVTDVGDTSFTSAIMIDDIQFSGSSQSAQTGVVSVTTISGTSETNILVWSSSADLLNKTDVKVELDSSWLATLTPKATGPTSCTLGFTQIYNFNYHQKNVNPGIYEFSGVTGFNFGIGGSLTFPVIEWLENVIVNQGDCVIIELQ